MEKQDFSFKKGWGQIQRKDMKEARKQIESALDINNGVSFYRRLNGDVEPKVSEAKAIEQVFANYGITEVWGN